MLQTQAQNIPAHILAILAGTVSLQAPLQTAGYRARPAVSPLQTVTLKGSEAQTRITGLSRVALAIEECEPLEAWEDTGEVCNIAPGLFD